MRGWQMSVLVLSVHTRLAFPGYISVSEYVYPVSGFEGCSLIPSNLPHCIEVACFRMLCLALVDTHAYLLIASSNLGHGHCDL
ncbi:hypothetical protein F5144DRAFT_581888 [Chaetomium tenue]|uniref:Uncharacterized protein n=1 Tax=Chaetomium tenue TaxID=1854479 RepID=A0ACB7NZ99_9PEZI|nr:hypothetical protein F5144DRAFT_581888 [Chaetomium globosum]